MSLVRLTTRNARRSPARGVMTVLAVAVAMVAYLLLRTLSANWTDRIEQTPNDRVVARHRIGWAQSLPVRYTEVVRGMEGVVRAVGVRWAGFKLPANEGYRFQSVAVDARDFVEMHYELAAPKADQESFVQTRNGALVSAELASELGWKRGDRVRFQSREYPGEWEISISAVVQSTRHGFGHNGLWMHWEYLNEGLPEAARDRVCLIAAQVVEPSIGARVAKAIDIRFDTEDDPTFSQEDKAFNTAMVGRFGAVLEAMDLVSLLVLGIVVLILGNTMAMATRERVVEFGTLRAIGFSPRQVSLFVVGEGGVLGAVGGLLGLVLAFPIVQGPASRILEENMDIAPLRIASDDALACLGACVVLGALSAALPALRAARMEVTDSLSRVP